MDGFFLILWKMSITFITLMHFSIPPRACESLGCYIEDSHVFCVKLCAWCACSWLFLLVNYLLFCLYILMFLIIHYSTAHIHQLIHPCLLRVWMPSSFGATPTSENAPIRRRVWGCGSFLAISPIHHWSDWMDQAMRPRPVAMLRLVSFVDVPSISTKVSTCPARAARVCYPFSKISSFAHYFHP